MTKVVSAPPRLRCAIYTRKSSEEGLDQAFNSLHAQREACEAYVLSQTGEGWTALPTIYDDGGFSGGNLNRPALQHLLADITAGRIDTVVVYKIDRLTRALADFAKIVEIFDAKGVSFVSVTQAFNTTTSMGRLTLNVLLSFAQFEREVTGERIRDKIAASKAKGMWMGGSPPLGYDTPTDLATRALALNPAEAETVRLIFRQYVELGSVHEVMRWLDDQGIRSKAWFTRAGKAMGGLTFSRGALFHLLKNRTYLGEIVHGEKTYPGAHTEIVDADLFAEVQFKLTAHARQFRERPAQVSTMSLKGMLFDADGSPMTPTFTHGARGQVYRYYVSAPLQSGARREPGDDAIRRLPASAIEDLVRDVLVRLTGKDEPSIKSHVARIEIHATTVQLLLRRSACLRRPLDAASELRTLEGRLQLGEHIEHVAADDCLARLIVRCRLRLSGGRIRVTDAAGKPLSKAPRPDHTLITALRVAHTAVSKSAGVGIGTPESAIFDVAPSSPYIRNMMRMAYLAPDIQAQILEGRQPIDLNRQRLMLAEIPLAWADQRRAFDTA
jgi:site-specific DNA recombinase